MARCADYSLTTWLELMQDNRMRMLILLMLSLIAAGCNATNTPATPNEITQAGSTAIIAWNALA